MFRFPYSYPYCTSFSKQNVLPKSHLLCYFDIIKYKTLYRNLISTSAHVVIYLYVKSLHSFEWRVSGLFCTLACTSYSRFSKDSLILFVVSFNLSVPFIARSLITSGSAPLNSAKAASLFESKNGAGLKPNKDATNTIGI